MLLLNIGYVSNETNTDVQHTPIHNDTSVVKESNMVNYDGILLELWKKKGKDEQIDELIHLVLTKQYTEKYKEVDPIWKDIENLQDKFWKLGRI